MKFSELLTEQTILLNFDAEDKWVAIKLLTARVGRVNQLHISDITDITRELIQREQEYNTGTGDGLAIPHISTSMVREALGGLAIIPEGLSFDAIDEQPVQWMVLIIIPQHRFREHLNTIANVAKVMHCSQFRQHLLRCTSSAEVLKCILNREEELTSYEP
ncbi:MAG: PTS sugar transporter subunit IIA [Gemmatimonadetes bacterium]|nr:MAG: PTS sugar transporter subunit IIA [Gemmatimonadota bacterium]